MSKSIKVTLGGISGAANAYYDMTDNFGNLVFTGVYGASLSSGITYSVNLSATSFTLTSYTQSFNSSSDVTPNSVIFGTVSIFNGFGYTYTTQQITGIDTPIILRTNFSAFTSPASLWYKIDTGSAFYAFGPTAPSAYAFQSIAASGTFSVSNNQYVSFGAEYKINQTQNRIITIQNTSDSNTVLGTFSALTDGFLA